MLILILVGNPLYSSKNPTVTIDSELGKIVIEIYLQKASITANNFLKYVKKGLYDNTVFHRTVRMDNQPLDKVKIEVIQALGASWKCNFAPIKHETTKETLILHKDGVVSMARDAPGSARSSFFICINDQPELDFGGKRNPDGQGFAAFGKVIKGMDIVKKIQNSTAKDQTLFPLIKIKKIYINKNSVEF